MVEAVVESFRLSQKINARALYLPPSASGHLRSNQKKRPTWCQRKRRNAVYGYSTRTRYAMNVFGRFTTKSESDGDLLPATMQYNFTEVNTFVETATDKEIETIQVDPIVHKVEPDAERYIMRATEESVKGITCSKMNRLALGSQRPRLISLGTKE